MNGHALLASLSGLREHLVDSEAVVGGVLIGMLVLLALTLGGRRWTAVPLVAFAGVWLLCNQRVEGPTVWAISYNHGVTVADLLSLVALLVAGWRLGPVVVRARRD